MGEKVRSGVYGSQWFSESVLFSAITSLVSVGLWWVNGRQAEDLITDWLGWVWILRGGRATGSLICGGSEWAVEGAPLTCSSSSAWPWL